MGWVMAEPASPAPSAVAEIDERPLLPITRLVSDGELRVGMLRWAAKRLLSTAAVAVVLLLAWHACGRPVSLLAAIWCVVFVQTFIVGPRLAADPAPAILHIDEPTEIVLVVLLTTTALGLWLTSVSGQWAALLGLLAGALILKIGVCRWEPSKDPADYR